MNHPRPFRISACCRVFLVFFLALALSAQSESPKLSPDLGVVDWGQKVLEMGTGLRLMCVAAHPDDEDSETLAYYNRGFGVRTSILLANWGEGGQNEIGPELYEKLGVIRSRETLEAAELLGTKVYCLNQKDFGYSKSLEETFRFWDKAQALERMVRVLRTERPQVVVTNHRVGRGHGNHQAMAQLIQEAIPLAASSEIYSHQLLEGLAPWKVERLYERRRHHEGEPEEDFDVRIPVGQVDITRGLSYQDIAGEALMRHRSQGVKGIWKFVNDRRKSMPLNFFYLQLGNPPLGPFEDLFQGIPGCWWEKIGGSPYLYNGIVNASPTAEDLRRKSLRKAYDLLFPDMDKVEAALEEALEAVKRLPTELDRDPRWESVESEKVINAEAGWSEADSAEYQATVIDRMQTLGREQKRIENLLAEMWGMKLVVDPADERPYPGDRFETRIQLTNQGSDSIEVESYQLGLPKGWTAIPTSFELGRLDPLGTATAVYQITVPTGELPTLPETTELYGSATPWQPNLSASATLSRGSTTVVLDGGKRIEVSPAWEVWIKPEKRLAPLSATAPLSFSVETRRLQSEAAETSLAILLPDGATETVRLPDSSPRRTSTRVSWQVPAQAEPGTVQLTARLSTPNGNYDARSELLLADLAVPQGLRVGIVRSYDDTLPAALAMLGVDFSLLAEEDLKAGNLKPFHTILVDIRAYLERQDLVESNHRLLDYVQNGGHLVVFYHKTYEWNDQSLPLAPLALELSDKRVTDERAAVTVLLPDHPLFNRPNKIGPADWEGWIQERGLYFPGTYDPQFQGLVAMSDPGEEPLESGILWARVGEGTYVYTSLVFYRQLRGVVPGAYRIFTNLISYPLVK